jgi:outer membrane biosynthesis protein TonB
MNNNEHLALFVLGVGTIGVTFLLLFALSDRNTGSIPVLEKQVQVSAVQAAVVPQAQTPEAPSTEALDREVAETFAKAAAYLGRGTFNEEEHIALLERLEFYGGLVSIKPEHKKAAQDLVKDMERLLTLKESVARQVKLAGQINAAETDAQMHLARGERSMVKARKIMDRIESLYAISGLSASQNRQLSTALAALKKAYRPVKKSASRAPAPSRKAETRKAAKPSAPAPAPVVKARVEPKPAPVVKAKVEPKPAPAVKAKVEPKPAPAVKAKVEPKPEPKPVPKVPVAATVPKKAKQTDSQIITTKYNKVMTYVSRYFVVRKYDQQQHDQLTADLLEISKSAASLDPIDQKRLSQTIKKMKKIDQKYRSKVSAR